MLKQIIGLCVGTLITFSALNADDGINIQAFRGQEITPFTKNIVQLVDKIYREAPYFYNGDDEGYTVYLESYSRSNDALICLVFDGTRIVGIAAGIPFSQTRDLYKKPLLDKGYDLNALFYVGEFGLNPEYQGRGIEDKMYQKLADFAKDQKSYKTMAMWQLDSSASHQGYITPETFWKTIGFVRKPELNFEISWTNIDDTVETPHQAIYWLKNL